MPDPQILPEPLYAWYSYTQAKIYGYAKYVTTENNIVYATNVSRDMNIDNIKERYPDIKYVGIVTICEDVFLK